MSESEMQKRRQRLMGAALAFCVAVVARVAGAEPNLAAEVDAIFRPLMAARGIPGMAVGVTVNGQTQVFTFGIRSLAGREPVTPDTLFEIGSDTKTFTAAIVAYAAQTGALSLSDRVDRFIPELHGTPFGTITLLQLATHTPGGLPLQVPEALHTPDQVIRYLKAWRPVARPGTIRTYSNVGIGVLGLVAARSVGRDFDVLVEDELLPKLGLRQTYLRVPGARQALYAQGYTADDKPVRLTPGVFWEEAYGLKTTVGDLLRFLNEAMGAAPVTDRRLAQALLATQTGYVTAGVLTQDLMWEQYAAPVSLKALLAGNAPAMIFNSVPATVLTPPLAPGGDVWINKTGSTAGFSAYVLFVPRARIGVVLLANKNYPIPDRVAAGHALVMRLLAATAR